MALAKQMQNKHQVLKIITDKLNTSHSGVLRSLSGILLRLSFFLFFFSKSHEWFCLTWVLWCAYLRISRKWSGPQYPCLIVVLCCRPDQHKRALTNLVP